MNIDIWLQPDLRLSRSAQVVGGEEKGGVIVRTVRQTSGFSERRWWNCLGLVMFSCLDKYKLVCRSLELHLILGFYSNISTAGMQKTIFVCIGVGPPASLKAAKIRMRFNWSEIVIESSTWPLKLPIVGHHHRDPLFWPWFFPVKKVAWWSAVQKSGNQTWMEQIHRFFVWFFQFNDLWWCFLIEWDFPIKTSMF